MKQKALSQMAVTQFQKEVYGWYHTQGRHVLPWRKGYAPYEILVSEVMLQQTQVDRVIPKFIAFLKQFPTIQSLATASQKELLVAWQGLGYNRRALFLQKAAQEIIAKYGGGVPRTQEELISLPAIGPYTAAAIRAFAFNEPSVVIETNIRAVYIHHFFPKKEKVSDEFLLPLIKQTLDTQNPRKWYSALMDYGTYLKKIHPNPTRRSTTHQKQSTFIGSDREVRGKILRILLKKPSKLIGLIKEVADKKERVPKIVTKLIAEGFIVEDEKEFLKIK